VAEYLIPSFSMDNLRVEKTEENTASTALPVGERKNRRLLVDGLRVERLALLLSVARDLSSILDLDHLLNEVGRLLRDIVPYEHFSLFLYDREREELTWRVGIGYSEESRRWLHRIPVAKGLVGRAVRTFSAVLSHDVSAEPDFLPAKTDRGEIPRSALAVPLIHQGEPVGVMTVESTRRGDFNDEQEQMLSALGGTLAIAILNARLYEELRSRERKLDNDLQLAKQVQRSMLPEEPPEIPGFEIGTAYHPADNLGGDFYDFLRLPSYRNGFVIADVSGKGVAAAMIMAASRGAVRSVAQYQEQPDAVLHAANRRLFRDIQRNVYVTICYGVLDPTQGSFTYSSAGHVPPVLVRGSGEVSYLEAGGTVLGMFDGSRFEEQTVSLRSGDLLCFYTDGIVDAFDGNDDVYGAERLEKLLLATRPLPAAEISRRIVASVEEFSRECPQHDDMTVVVLKSV
jgi:sigma-B regulation protein RsbU (phosphoserine phosphatase)